MTTADRLAVARRVECEEDGLYFSRYFFKHRMGSKMLIAPHHRIIQKTLDRVVSGEINRLIINISPGYTKTELATINMIARGLALNNRARFLHLSYSHNLALLNSSTARAMVKSAAFQEMWPMALKDDADSKAMWWTENGGGVYASSAAGQVTGFRAGHMEAGWQGCFPEGTLVETEHGPRPIDEVVASRKPIKVWSYNHSEERLELQPVIGWWKNPPNSIVEVKLSDGVAFECTPDHKIYTVNRGYVRADLLTGSDVLPTCSPHAFEGGVGHTEQRRNFAPGSGGVEQNIIADRAYPLASGDKSLSEFQPFSNRGPSLPSSDLSDDAGYNAETPSAVFSRFRGREYLDNLVPVKLGPGATFKKRKSTVSDSVRHVLGLSAPCEVESTVVCRAAVKVPTLIARLFGAIKSLKNQLVNVLPADLALARKAYPQVAVSVDLGLEQNSGEHVLLTSRGCDEPIETSDAAQVADLVGSFVSRGRNPILVRHVRHVENSYCLTVRCNSNFILSNGKVLVHNCLLIDDPVKPDDAFSETIRDGINNRFNETIKSRLAIESTPIVVIMQRIHYNDLSGYLLRGGSGERWHHLNLPVIIDNSEAYPEENTHGVPIDHGLPDGWLWPFKHNESHRVALTSHRRTFEAQYMQKPRRFNAEGALWTESLISAAHNLHIRFDKVRSVVAIDPQATNSDESDETGIIAASSYGHGDKRQFLVEGDYSGKFSPGGWAKKAMHAYNEHEADAIVIETNQGGDMAESTLKNAGFKGRIIRVHASKGKFARAEPISALYEQGRVAHRGSLYTLENQLMEYVPATSKKSPDRLDAMVYAITELGGGSGYSWQGF